MTNKFKIEDLETEPDRAGWALSVFLGLVPNTLISE
jgi:hypothetical protein